MECVPIAQNEICNIMKFKMKLLEEALQFYAKGNEDGGYFARATLNDLQRDWNMHMIKEHV